MYTTCSELGISYEKNLPALVRSNRCHRIYYRFKRILKEFGRNYKIDLGTIDM